MKKQMEKLQVRINQNLNRSEKSVALPHELEKIEETVMVYRQVCSTLHKKLCDYLPSAGKCSELFLELLFSRKYFPMFTKYFH